MADWLQIGNDIDGASERDSAGESVSLSRDGTVLAIGSPKHDVNGYGINENSGHTRIYQYSSGSWSQLGSDIDDGDNIGDFSGYSVSLSDDGTIVAIGAYGSDGSQFNNGHTRIYQYSSGSWSQLGSDIDGDEAYDSSGVSVSLSADGSIVAIGADGDSHNGSGIGHTRIYQYSSGSWSQLGSDIEGETDNDYSGRYVSLSADGTIVAIGATNNDGNGNASGHTRIYQYSSVSNSWSQLGSDIDGEAANDYSGRATLSDDGTIVAIGAINNDGNGNTSGHTRIYKYSSGSNSWSQLGSDIDGEAADDYSGYSLSLSEDGTMVAIGAIYNDGNGNASGHTRIYQYSSVSNSWSQLGSDINGEAANDYSGSAVSLSSDGTIVAIGATNNDGNGSNSGHVRVFQLDNTSPTISSFSPADNATDVATESNIVLNFSEAVDVETGNIVIYKSSDNSVVETIDVTSNKVTGTGTTQITINPSIDLDGQTEYYLQIGATAFDDSASNSYAGISDTTTLSFTTIEKTAPTIASFSPADDATAVATNSNIVLTFSEAVDVETGNIVIYKASDDSVAETIDVTSNKVTGTGTTQITINPSNDLVHKTEYYVHIDTTAFDDTAGNSYAGINNNTILNFTTTGDWIQIGSDINGEAANDYSGSSLSLSSDGTTVAIGAANNDENGSNSGHVRIYQYSSGSNSWAQLGSDIDGEAANDYSGRSVSLSADGTIVAIGANKHDGNEPDFNIGHTRIYQYSSGSNSWAQLGSDIDGEAAYDESGSSISISDDGTRVAIGAIYNMDNGTYSGHVRIYQYSSGSNSWAQLGSDIDGEAAGDYSGRSVSLSADGTTVAIGAASDGNGVDSGHVRIYQYSSGSNSWSQLGSDIDGEASSDFASGESVSLSSDGTIVAIGAPNNDGNGSNSGHTRIYKYSSGSNSWSQLGSDIDGEAADDYSGYSLSLSEDGTMVAIGATNNDGNGNASGHTRIYQYSSVSNSWAQLASDIDGEAAGDFAGSAVSLSSDGTIVAIGAANNGGNGSNSGHVRVFQLDNTSPTISSFSPADDATAVATNSNIVLTFSEAVDVETGNFIIYKTSDNTAVETIDVTSSKVTGSGTNQITINPGNDLAESTAFYVQIAGTAFDDSYGNSYAGISDTTTLSFTTADETAPTFSSAATNTAGTKVILTYNEALSATTAATTAFAVTTGGSSNSVTAATVSGSTVELTLTTTVKNDEAVTVAYTDPSGSNDANAIQDSSGNDVATLTSTSVTNNSTVVGSSSSDSSSSDSSSSSTSSSDSSSSDSSSSDSSSSDSSSSDSSSSDSSSTSTQITDGIKVAEVNSSYVADPKGFASISGSTPVTVTSYEIGKETTLDSIKDYDGNLHAGDNLAATASSYKYQGMLDVNGDGVFETIFTNKSSKRWVTAKVDSNTGQIDFDDNGPGGGTRVVGIYADPLIAEGENNGGYLSDGVTPAPANFGVSDADRYVVVNGETIDRLALNSQVRFQNDLEIDNLQAKHSGDYDGDEIHEVYWKTNDGTAYLRSLMHADGNIRYANYQSEAQMKEYLTANGDDSVISEIVS